MLIPIISIVLALSVHGSHAQENVPFIAWSNQKFFEDVPAAPVGTVTDSQHARSLLDSIMQENQLILLFKFNKLSVDDISKYGSVYQASSNGGSLSNFKNAYENSVSHLPLLLVEPGIAEQIEEQASHHTIRFNDDWQSQLSERSQANLLLVPLELISDSASSMGRADERMKSVLDVASQLSMKYTAILTADMPNRIPSSKSDQVNLVVGRHLLEKIEDDSQVVSFTENDCNALLYASMIKVDIDNKSFQTLEKVDWNTDKSNCTVPNTAKIVMSSTGPFENFTLFELTFNVHTVKSGFYWNFNEGSAAVTPIDGGTVNLLFKINTTDTPTIFSYHCGYTELKNVANSQLVIKLAHFQIQPFNVNVSEEKFARAHDCVGFFTEGIWMALVTTLILVMILYFGVSMLASLTVMDQFDDPKGKTITVNVAD